MKQVLFFLFCCLSFNLYGQNSFAPNGAVWYHEMLYGSFHSYTDGDTVIKGLSAKRIRQIALTK